MGNHEAIAKKLPEKDYFDQMVFLYTKSPLRLDIPKHLKIELNPQKEGGLIFDSKEGSMYALSSTAAFVLSLFQGGETMFTWQEILKSVTDTYDVEASQIEDDLIEFVCRLKDLNIGVKGEK